MDFYNQKVEAVLKIIKTSKDGLTNAQAAHRLEKNGLNQIKSESRVNPLKIFIEQFKSFIIYILLFAVVLTLVLEHYTDAILILIILFANAIIGFFQEYSAQKSLEALKNLGGSKAKVFRDGSLREIDAKFLTVGDIVYLEAGDKVPADCRIIDDNMLKVEEAALTGESLPVNKIKDVILEKVGIGDMKNMLFSSTTIVSGTARAVVTSVGMKTQIGRIATMIEDAQEEMTPLQKRLDLFGKQLGYVIIIICLFIFLALIMTKGYSLDNLLVFGLVAVSLAVAAVPTALPAVVTVALSIGVKRLLSKKALVRKLSSVETLGSCDIICTDKTGTLTKNEMTVRKVWTVVREAEVEGAGYNPVGHISSNINHMIFRIGYYCNNASLYKEDGIWQISGDPTEGALIVSAKKAQLKEDNVERLSEIPFDSSRKLMSTLVLNGKKLEMYTKGAPDNLLKICSHIMINGVKKKLTEELRKEVHEKNVEYSQQALRVLGFAYKDCKSNKDFIEKDLVFVGLQAMIDPPREDVIESIKKTKDAGIRVIMITGDYVHTAKAIGREVGIEGGVMSGTEIDEIDDEQLKKILKNKVNVFARVVPEHKQRIVSALQELGHTVAMTGDGVNDAPALKKANIGVAVGSGTEVAKEAADFVLLDDSFSNIVNAIEEGRGIYDNIQKSIMLLLSGNVGEVLIIFLAVLFGFNLPLTAVLLLWINLITDGAPALAFAVDPYNKQIMQRHPNREKSILPAQKMTLIGVLGFVGSLIGLLLFEMFGGDSGRLEFAQTMLFCFVVLYEIVLVFIIRKQYGIRQFSNLWLWFAIIVSFILQATVIYTPLSKFFGVVSLSLEEVGFIFGAGFVFWILYLIYAQIERGVFSSTK